MAKVVGDVRSFLNIVKRRLKDISLQNWYSQINYLPKALHYKHFKLHLDIEVYLIHDLIYIWRKTLTYIWCSSHSLAKGRHEFIKRELRFRQFGLKRNVYVVEDKFNFFMLCPYVILRDMYFRILRDMYLRGLPV